MGCTSGGGGAIAATALAETSCTTAHTQSCAAISTVVPDGKCETVATALQLTALLLLTVNFASQRGPVFVITMLVTRIATDGVGMFAVASACAPFSNALQTIARPGASFSAVTVAGNFVAHGVGAVATSHDVPTAGGVDAGAACETVAAGLRHVGFTAAGGTRLLGVLSHLLTLCPRSSTTASMQSRCALACTLALPCPNCTRAPTVNDATSLPLMAKVPAALHQTSVALRSSVRTLTAAVVEDGTVTFASFFAPRSNAVHPHPPSFSAVTVTGSFVVHARGADFTSTDFFDGAATATALATSTNVTTPNRTPPR